MARQGLRAGNGAAKLLVRLRVILAGEGVIREDHGVFRATLPGQGHMLEIDDRSGTAVMTQSSGQRMSRDLDLRNETHFLTLMLNVDSAMSGANRIPTTVLRLADEYAAALAAGDEVLSSIVSNANLALGRMPETWTKPATLYALAEAARRSDRARLVDAAEAALGDPDAAPRYSQVAAKSGWADIIERWSNSDGASYPAGGAVWVQVVTRVGLASVAERIGLTIEGILDSEGAGSRTQLEDAGVFALYDAAGDVAAIATAVDGNLTVRKGDGAGADEDEVAALRDGLDMAPPGMAP